MTVTEQKGVTNTNWKCGAYLEANGTVHFEDVYSQLSPAVVIGEIF